MGVAVALVVLIAASLLFHFLSPWYFTEIASNWSAIDDTISITFWVTGVVFVLVNAFMAYAVYRYKHRADARAHYEPENKKLEWWLLAITTVGVAAMLAPGLFTWWKFIDVPKDAAVVEAVGQQWNWKYRLPGKDGKLGLVNARYITDANPFGMVPDDPAGQDDVLVSGPELHLPINKPVKMLLRSNDVLHNFTITQVRVKMDLVPGLVSHLWFTPTKAGTYDVLCEELCGIAHFAMRSKVVVEDDVKYAAWLDQQGTYSQIAKRPAGDPAAGQALYAVCAACHGAAGEGNQTMNAPKLAGQGAWYLKRQLVNYKQGLRGTHEKDTNGKVMAPMAATLADERAIDNVVAYIGTLPDKRAGSTLRGNARDGQERYVTCGGCHGADGSGALATNAPRLQGMSDWYMAAQLKNFRDGIRGGHPQDLNGAQMALFARMLRDDRSIADVLAYIDSLEIRTKTASADR
jgi:cytochrome c oxidase subunit 2